MTFFLGEERGGNLKKFLCSILIFLCFASILCAPKAVSSADEPLQFGINFYATNHHYREHLTDGILDRDFGLFQDQGFKFVIVEAIWKYHEPLLGIYDEEAIDDLIRVCNFADKYDIGVVIDFHTRMGSNQWTMPTWLTNRNFETVLLNDTARQAWLNFLGHMAERLDVVENLVSWQMMNEPGWEKTIPTENFTNSWIDLWTEMRGVFKSYSDKPVSIRFDEALVRSDYFNCDPRICDICDDG